MNKVPSQQQSSGQAQGRQSSHSPSKGKKWWRDRFIIAALIGAAGAIIAAIIAGVFLLGVNWPNKGDQVPTPTPVLTISPTPTPTPPPANVRITSPANGDKVPRPVTVQGTASYIPQDEQLWILVQPVGTSLYFPQPGYVEVSTSDGTWTCGVFVGKDDPTEVGKEFVLWAALADQVGSAAIQANLQENKAHPGQEFKPLDSLKGIQMITHVSVVRT